jgi:hypothetical protein
MMDALSSGSWTSQQITDGGYYDLSLPSISCPSTTNCAEVGSILNYGPYLNGYDAALTFNGSSWSGVTLPLPSNASIYGTNFNNLSAVSCPSANNCVAVGRYQDGSELLPLIETETNGTWKASEGVMTSDQSTTNYNDNLVGVSCWSVNNCVAVGYYVKSGVFEGLIETDTNGTWSASAAPTTSAMTGTGSFLQLWHVACFGAGSCVTTGTFSTGSANGLYAGTLGAHGWTAAVIPEPSNAALGGTANPPGINQIVCTAANSCVAVGFYQIGGGTTQIPLIAIDANGVWSSSVPPQPAGNSPDSFTEQLYSVSCVATGDCVAVGASTNSSQDDIPLIDVEAGTTWSLATYSPPKSTTGWDLGRLSSVSCVSTGACVAGGQAAGQPLVESITLPPPAQVVTVAPFAFKSAALTPALDAQVLRAAHVIKTTGDKVVSVVGYSDNKQPAALSLLVSKQRALAVVALLHADLTVLKVKGVVVTAKGLGQANPTASNATPAGQALNRRVTVTIS